MAKLLPLAAALLLSVLPGCAASGVRELAKDPWAEARQREWDQLNRLKSNLRWDHDAPVDFSFPGQGEVRVRSWALEGGPGWEYVRAEFTYENTTDKSMDHVDVELHVLDHRGATVAAARVRLEHPWGLPLAPGTFFSDEIRAPARGVHLDPRGWHWTVRCRAVHGSW
jgi:hypothetical protein